MATADTGPAATTGHQTTPTIHTTAPAGPSSQTISRPEIRPSGPTTATSRKPPATTPSAPGPVRPAIQIAHGSPTRPQVALTFHGAGDIGYAREILRIAGEKRARITVMAVGTWLKDNPFIGKEILAGGHELGNHTLSHLDINSLPEKEARAEIVGCRELLRQTAGVPGVYFRQSQSQTANALVRKTAAEAGYGVCLSYNVDSMDWTDPGANAVRKNTAAAGRGAIVSMHLGHSDTVQALPGVLDDLRRRGLSAVTVSTLLRH